MQGKDLDKLVAKIISGEVVLFAGSGLSLYAGYPSAWKLAADLLILLDSEEIADSRLTEQSDLLEIAQVIEDLKGRDILVNKISEIFGRSTVKNLEVHEMIVKIPFIRDIITTNYDYLFEAAYGPSLRAIVDTTHLGNISGQKVNLFKIHGDPDNPEAIVLTRDDYARFYRRNINTPLLSVIQERLTTKTVLFVGYSLQDINIRGEFMYALESLGTNAKEAYLVSPSSTKSNQISLKKKGVKYLSYSGEQFFKLIFEKISDRIIDDALHNRTNLNHSESFLQSQDVYVDYDTSKGQREIAKAGSISGKGKPIIQMTFTDDGIHHQIQSLIKGSGTSKVSIPAEHLISIITTINGINIPLFKDGVSIELFKEPNRKGNFDIRFEDGLEINDLPYEINKSSGLIEIKINIKTGILTISFNPQNDRPDEMPITLSFKHNQICSNALDEINAFHLLNNFAVAKPFTIFAEGKKSRFQLRSAKDIIDNAANLLQHFKNLNFIEQRFNVKFKNLKFGDQTTHNIEVVKNLLEQIDGKEKLFTKRGELYALGSDNAAAYDKENLEILFGKKNFEIPNYTETFYNLFDQKISVGYLYIRVINAVFKNKEDVLSGKDKKIIYTCDEEWFSYISEEELQARIGYQDSENLQNFTS